MPERSTRIPYIFVINRIKPCIMSKQCEPVIDDSDTRVYNKANKAST